jgi:hypothetical protein
MTVPRRDNGTTNRPERPSLSAPSVLPELIGLPRACREMLSEYMAVEQEKGQVGGLLKLYGPDKRSAEHLSGCCHYCERVFSTISVIPDWLFPPERMPAEYEIDCYTLFISDSPDGGRGAEVVMTIGTVPRGDSELSANDRGRRAPTWIQARLKALAAHEHKVLERKESL